VDETLVPIQRKHFCQNEKNTAAEQAIDVSYRLNLICRPLRFLLSFSCYILFVGSLHLSLRCWIKEWRRHDVTSVDVTRLSSAETSVVDAVVLLYYFTGVLQQQQHYEDQCWGADDDNVCWKVCGRSFVLFSKEQNRRLKLVRPKFLLDIASCIVDDHPKLLRTVCAT